VNNYNLEQLFSICIYSKMSFISEFFASILYSSVTILILILRSFVPVMEKLNLFDGQETFLIIINVDNSCPA